MSNRVAQLSRSGIILILLNLLFVSLSTAQSTTTETEAGEFNAIKASPSEWIERDADPEKALRAVAVLTKRLSNSRAQADFLIYDKLSSLVLEIQPVKYVGHQYEAAGETATIKMSSSALERDYKDFSSPSSIFSVSEDVVAVRLKIYYSESPELSTLTIIAPIENASRLTKVKIVGDSAGVAKSKFVIMKTSVEASGDNLSNSYTCNCPLVELENTTCGYKCKY